MPVPVKVVNVQGKIVTRSDIEFIEKVSDIVDKLNENGEKRVCNVLLGDRQLELNDFAKDCGFQSTSNQVTIVFWTARGLTSSGFTVRALIDVDAVSKSCRAQKGFKPEGYALQELIASGFRVSDLKDAACTPLSLITAGFSMQDLKSAGYTVLDMKSVCQSVFGAGTYETMQKLGELGFEVSDMRNAGFKLSEIRKALCYKVTELALAGYNLYDFYDAGYTVSEILELNLPASDLKRVGYNAAQMRDGGYTARNLREVGYPLAAMKSGGFEVSDLRDAGFSCWVVGSSGFTLKQLRSGGFSNEDITAAGFAEPAKSKATSAAESLRLKLAGTAVLGVTGSKRHAITV
jgi:hypothetical protein